MQNVLKLLITYSAFGKSLCT